MRAVGWKGAWDASFELEEDESEVRLRHLGKRVTQNWGACVWLVGLIQAPGACRRYAGKRIALRSSDRKPFRTQEDDSGLDDGHDGSTDDAGDEGDL